MPEEKILDITKLDQNFAVQTVIDRTDLCFYDVEEFPFRVYGTKMLDGRYRRMPEAVAAATNNGVREMHTHTAGARVRFVTDSPRIAIRVVIDSFLLQPHPSAEEHERLAVVRATYENALAAGDRNVYFIPGSDLMRDVKNEGLVDNVHPNDAGFLSMARVIAPVLKKMISV